MNAIVIDPPFPQLTQLAGHLGRHGNLHGYVHPFADKNGSLQRRARPFPVVGERMAREFARRSVSCDIPVESVHLAGTSFELLRYGLHHVQRLGGVETSRLQEHAILARNKRLSVTAARHLDGADTVVGSFGTALEAFTSARGKPVLKVLDYPIVYYRHSIQILDSERRRQPRYAATLQEDRIHPEMAARLDAECEMADRILVGSEFAKRSFTHHGFSADKIMVVPYGADLEMFNPGPPNRRSDDRFTVLFVGQIGQRKGVADLLDAYRKIRTPEMSLQLVGNFVGSPKAFERDRTLFEHIPHAPRSALSELYRQASVLVLPSHLEGMGLVVLEAMACGTPVIVSDRGPNQVVRDGLDGYVVPAGNADVLAERLHALAIDPACRHRMGAAAAERARTFTWSAYFDGVIKALGDAT